MAENASWHAARMVLRLVAELHLRGYQRLRISPGMAPSGLYWRCPITPASNISALNGALMASFDEALVAPYSSSEGANYFGWKGAATATATKLAGLFIERFPRIAEAGRGSDWLYAGWYVDMMSRTYPNAFPIAYADWELPKGKLTTVGGKEVDIPLPPPGSAPQETDLVKPQPPDGRLVLAAGHWYAMELYDPGQSSHPVPSPIKVLRITPLRTGASLIELEFFHANCPRGAQFKIYRLRTIKRCTDLYIGERSNPPDERIVLISPLDREWMERRVPSWAMPKTAEIESFLERTLPGQDTE